MTMWFLKCMHRVWRRPIREPTTTLTAGVVPAAAPRQPCQRLQADLQASSAIVLLISPSLAQSNTTDCQLLP